MNLLKGNLRQYGMVMALLLITVLFQILTGGILLQPLNITNLVLQNSYILILAIGMLLVIVTGNIDLSVGSIVACYIGGASAMGGVGTVYGAIIGGLVMGILNNGMSILGIGVDVQQAIKGIVLLMAVAFDVYTKNKTSKIST